MENEFAEAKDATKSENEVDIHVEDDSSEYLTEDPAQVEKVSQIFKPLFYNLVINSCLS